MKVTDEMAEKVIRRYARLNNKSHIALSRIERMRDALEAVFDSIPEKPDNSIFNSFPHEAPVMPEGDQAHDIITMNDIISCKRCNKKGFVNGFDWGECKSDTVKPEKKTLLEYAESKFDFEGAAREGIAYNIIKTISEYLEKFI